MTPGPARLVFTVTPGRSGTGLLAALLSGLRDTSAHHEPEPHFARSMRSAQLDPDAALEFWEREKLPAIERQPGDTYVETSHLFCKGFLEPLLALGRVPDLVLLTRPHREVATSLLSLGTVPGRGDKATRFYLQPDDPGVLPLPGWRSLHDYQLCFWYCLEIERRAALYAPMVRERGGRVLQISLDELSTASGFASLLGFLDRSRVEPRAWRHFLAVRRRRVNDKRAMKRASELPTDVEALESGVRRAVGA